MIDFQHLYDFSKQITSLGERARAKSSGPGVQFGKVSASYVSGNPALVLAGESTSTAGTKTHLVQQPVSNRFGALVASDAVLIPSDNDDNRIIAGKPVSVSSLVVDADYIMGLRPVTPGNTLLLTAATERSTTSATYVEKKRFRIERPGKYRIGGQLSRTGGQTSAIVRILLSDGVTLVDATAAATYSGTVYPTYGSAFALDMTVGVGWGGIIVIYLLNDSGPGQTGYIKSATVSYADASASLAPDDRVVTD